jgi:hypothetical protein
MSSPRKSLCAAVVLSCLSGTASAQQIDPAAPLVPGGLTISGPGAVQGQPGDNTFFWASTSARDICVTVVNFGTVSINVTLSSAQFTSVSVGRTIALCAPNTTNATAHCGTEAGGQCRYLWRVGKAG